MNYLAISGILIFITSGFTALFVLLKAPRRGVTLLWSLFSFAVASWGFGLFMAFVTDVETVALFWGRFLNLSAIFIPLFFFHFVLCFTERIRVKRKELFLYYAISLTYFLLAIIFQRTFVSHVGPIFSFKYYPKPGFLYYLFGIIYTYLVARGIYFLFKELHSSSGIRKNQIKYLLFGVAIGFAGGATTFFPVFDIKIYPFGTYFVPIYVLTVTYAILKYRLMAINVALTRAGIFAVVYALVLGVPFWLGYVTKSWLSSTTLAVLLATLGPFIYTSLRQQAENRLLAEDLKKYDTLKKFARTMGLVRDLDKLVRLIVYRLVKTLKVSYGAIYLFDEEEKAYTLKSSRIFQGPKPLPSTNSIPEDNDFVKFLQEWHKDLLYEDVQRLLREEKPNNRNNEAEANNRLNLAKVTSRMQELNACLVIPHFLERELIGFLVLGSKLSGRPYSEADIEVLTTLSRSASLAIMNAVFMIELKKTEGELAETHRVAQLGYLLRQQPQQSDCNGRIEIKTLASIAG